jgi:integrase
MAQRHGRIEKGGRRSIATICRYVVVLHAILERARRTLREANIDMVNHAADVDLRKADNSLARCLTMEQEGVLLQEVPQVFRPIIRVALYTGLRQGELLRLTWADVDEASGTLQIRETKNDTPRRAWIIPWCKRP